MSIRKIKNSWWVDFRAAHVRHRLRSPENSKAGAAAYEAFLRQKLARGELIGKDFTARRVPTFGEFAWQWFDQYVMVNNKPLEQKSKRNALRNSLIPFFGKMAIGTITAYSIEQYKTVLLKQGIKPKTINNRLTILRKCLITAHDWLEIGKTPPKIAWLKCPPLKIDYLSPDECDLLLSHADGWIHNMILMGLRTGMRQGELRGLQWSSIDWYNRLIIVRHSQCDYTKELSSPKSNRERHIPIDVDVYAMLFTKKQSTGYVFASTNGGPFRGTYIERKLKVLCKKAGLRPIGWHTLRHTFASHLAMRGVPLNAVQALLGHSTITVTMRYAHLAPSTLRAAIDTLNPKTAYLPNFGQPVGNTQLDAIMQETIKP